MKKSKHERLKKAGWKVGTAQEFLVLSDEENALIEKKLELELNRCRESLTNMTPDRANPGFSRAIVARH